MKIRTLGNQVDYSKEPFQAEPKQSMKAVYTGVLAPRARKSESQLSCVERIAIGIRLVVLRQACLFKLDEYCLVAIGYIVYSLVLHGV